MSGGRRVVVVGFGVTGRAVSRALVDAGDVVTVFDDRPDPGAAALADSIGIVVEPTPSGSVLRERLAAADLVVPSPGVPVAHPVYGAAAEVGAKVVSEIELAAEMAAERGAPELVAITGTNGKTTVTTLVTAMLDRAGRKAVAGGNIGFPLIEAVNAGGVDVVVAEVSSFQLQYTETFRPRAGCWLNLAPDHLDWHPTHEHARPAKARIWRNQSDGDTAIYNLDDEEVAAATAAIPSGVARTTFSIRGGADYRMEGEFLTGPDGSIMDSASLPRRFPHDLANSLAAAATAQAAGASVEACRAALEAGQVLPHRVTYVGEAGGVRWYDDSKATTPASVLAAAAAFPSVVLIAGGRNKGLDLGVLAAAVPPVRAVVAIGEAAAEVGAAFADLVPVETATDMAQAVTFAANLAVAGDSVLLSPGCASFDWYTSYGARGDHFVSLVKEELVKGGTKC